jgi:hypothetical protein
MGKKRINIEYALKAPNIEIFPYIVLADSTLSQVKILKDEKKNNKISKAMPMWFYATSLENAEEIADKLKTTCSLIFICKIDKIVEGVPFEDVINYAND